ncbi:MAG: serine/threonine-protein kinase, partial [Planctomycetota bacterium]|nr:serine/threonine-protein kinase [Planctomycetota bacterium]
MEILDLEFDGYEVEGVLFRKADTTLCRAREVASDRWVLLEVLDLSSSVERRGRFHHGTDVMQTVSDSGIAALLGHGEVEGRLFRVLEDFEGAPLTLYLTKREAIPYQAALDCGRQVALALAAVHEAGFVHRDVQPDNIWIEVGGRVLLAGFGAVLDSSEEAPGMTLIGEGLGDPRFRSPEQYVGKEGCVGPASDQFALGVVLYRLLFGCHPFSGSSEKKMVEALCHQDLHFSDILEREKGGLLQEVVVPVLRRVLAKRPEERYPDCRELAVDLDASVRCFVKDTVAMTRISFSVESGMPEDDLTKEVNPLGSTRYRNPVELDRGGAGVVFAVTDPDLERSVAIKILHGDGSEPIQEKERRFLREAKITGQLEHPNIVPVYELGHSSDGKPFFAMKRIEGHSLHNHMGELGARLGTERTRLLGVFLKICDGVSFAHSKQIVHRDLKPANIMLGEYGEVWVVDWGLARYLGESVGFGSSCPESTSNSWRGEVTIEGTIMGTPTYMAPEQARGHTEGVDTRTDIYALGVMLYRILTGELPYEGESSGEVIEKVLGGYFLSPSERTSGLMVPRELDAVVLKAMASDPADRYATVLGLQKDIQAYLDGRTLVAATYSPGQRVLKWVRRNRKVCLAVIGMMVVFGAFFGFDRWRSRVVRR